MGQKIKQTPKFLQAVESLKTAITTEPILAHPQWGEHDEKFNLYTDWSNKAIAAKITQDQLDDKTGKLVPRVILYDSKKLIKQQSRMDSNKGELFFLHLVVL